jgi:hypothetical protein
LKRSELIRELLAAGCFLHRHGAKHDIYRNPATGQKPHQLQSQSFFFFDQQAEASSQYSSLLALQH